MSETTFPKLFVTGASGQLGRLVVAALLRRMPAARIVAGVRDTEAPAAQDLRAQGVEVRSADYARPEILAEAFAGIDRLLLISSSEVGQRVSQHRNVIEAAGQAGVELIAYTSLLHADTSPLGLAEEHRATEAILAQSGMPTVILRNGWYTENHTASLPQALAHGIMLGSAGAGRIAGAARADYAEAAAAVLTADMPVGRIYELAGDEAYTLADVASEAARVSGRPVRYQDLPPAEYRAALVGTGLPAGVASLLADSDRGAADGALFDDGHDLRILIGRPTTPLATVIAGVLK
ncbi:NAD(P)-dependent oxidoreductase [Methylobacterium sp. Leaf104]|uniref:SDR family oxidoreductase n=1 Tax=Methylobacterium TaxID=407 RepID=UPI0006F9640A|nr:MULTISPECIES: SDR family oxidoreductase [Methylobacterium]KQP31828.1 NAD(P)-dependent oxidoreductase [Methylobacterium sp. Leaf104]MCI9880756.1 SDR family oxidoreductase [Methylobacterium goesingense]